MEKRIITTDVMEEDLRTEGNLDRKKQRAI